MADETKEELTGRDAVVEEEDEDRPWRAVSAAVFQEPPQAGVAGSPRRFTDIQQAHTQAKLKHDTPSQSPGVEAHVGAWDSRLPKCRPEAGG